MTDINTNNKPKFFVVATPIGNRSDFSERAISTLKSVDIIVCEDSRVSQKLLGDLGIKKPFIIYNDHATERTRAKILDKLSTGETMALISDAGTPGISDPGYKLLNTLHSEGITYSAIPGPCAAINALVLSGMPTDAFLFLGFFEKKKLSKAINCGVTSVLYESKHRIIKTLSILEDYGVVEVCVIREMTKLFEEVIRGKTSEVASSLEKRASIKGEFVIVIPPQNIDVSLEDITDEIKGLLKSMHTKEVTEILHKKYINLKKKEIYNLAINLKN